MDWSGWASFGFGATIALTGIMVFSQLMGLSRMDLPMMLGTMFVAHPDRARVAGFLVHLLNGQMFALLYFLAFNSLGFANWWLGLLFGLAHGMAALIIMIPLLPGIHPKMASERAGPGLDSVLEPPGLMGLNYGSRTPIVILTAHGVFGLILGSFARPF
jgi:hypothetical protein